MRLKMQFETAREHQPPVAPTSFDLCSIAVSRAAIRSSSLLYSLLSPALHHRQNTSRLDSLRVMLDTRDMDIRVVFVLELSGMLEAKHDDVLFLLDDQFMPCALVVFPCNA